MTRLDRLGGSTTPPPAGDQVAASRGPTADASAPADERPRAGRVGGTGRGSAFAPAPARAAPVPPAPIAPADLQQAAYILARGAMGRPLPSAQEALLWQGNDTRKTVLDLLPHGRGNVVTDVEATNRVSYQRTFAARAVVEGWPRRGVFDPEVAALTTLAGSGNCSEMVNLAAHVHAEHLQPGDRVLAQQVGFIDHTWLRVQCATPDGAAHGTGHAAIIDAWAEGPVADPADTRLPSGSAGEVSNSQRMDSAAARTSARTFEQARTDVEERHGEQFAQSLQRGIAGWHILSDPEPLLHGRFVYDARQAVEAASPEVLRASAVAVLRSAPAGFAASQAEEHADAVVAWARDLRRAHPRSVRATRPASDAAAAAPEGEAP